MPDLDFIFDKGWGSDYDQYNVPDGYYLRGDNLVTDIPGVVQLRPGTRRLGSQLDGPVYGINSSSMESVTGSSWLVIRCTSTALS